MACIKRLSVLAPILLVAGLSGCESIEAPSVSPPPLFELVEGGSCSGGASWCVKSGIGVTLALPAGATDHFAFSTTNVDFDGWFANPTCSFSLPISSCSVGTFDRPPQGWISNTTVSYTMQANYTDAVGNLTFRVQSDEPASKSGVLHVRLTPWPNNSELFSTITDWPMAALSGTGWSISDNLHTSVVTDAGAPFSPSNVVDFAYPEGFVEGTAPGTLTGALDSPRTELYFGFWWKPSNPWENHPTGVNKIVHLADNYSGNKVIVDMHGSGGAYYIEAALNQPAKADPVMPGANNAHLAGATWGGNDSTDVEVPGSGYAITLGQWYRIEVYVKMSTSATSQDGILRWWVTPNGGTTTQVGNYTTVNYNTTSSGPSPFVELRFSPTWGGDLPDTTVTKTGPATDHFWFDHALISGP